jgi:hypothetical protein
MLRTKLALVPPESAELYTCAQMRDISASVGLTIHTLALRRSQIWSPHGWRSVAATSVNLRV